MGPLYHHAIFLVIKGQKLECYFKIILFWGFNSTVDQNCAKFYILIVSHLKFPINFYSKVAHKEYRALYRKLIHLFYSTWIYMYMTISSFKSFVFKSVCVPMFVRLSKERLQFLQSNNKILSTWNSYEIDMFQG